MEKAASRMKGALPGNLFWNSNILCWEIE